MYKRVIRFSAS